MMNTIGLFNEPQGNVADANPTCRAYDAVVAPSAYLPAAPSDAAARSRGSKAAFDPNYALKLQGLSWEKGWHTPRYAAYGTLRLG